MKTRVVTPSTTPQPQTPVSAQPSSERKEQKIVALPKFRYLWMSEAKFATLRDGLELPGRMKEISKEDAEKLIAQNKGTFNLEYGLDFFADCTNGFFPTWLIKTGSSGALLCMSVLGSVPQSTLQNNNVLNIVTYVGVLFNAVLAGLQWILMYSPWKEAIKHTLKTAANSTAEATESMLQSFINEMVSLIEQLKTAFDDALQNPKEGTLKLLKFLLFQLVTKLIDVSAASTELFFTPAGFTWIFAILLLAFATRYSMQIWDSSVAEGMDFWLDPRNQSPLFEQIKAGNFGVIYKMITEAFGTVALRGMQYKFIAEGNQQLLGFWAPPNLMILCAVLHGLFLNYPTAFKNIMLPFEKLERALNEKISEKIDTFIETQIQALREIPNEEKDTYLKTLAARVKTELMADDLSAAEYKNLPKSFDEKLEKLLQQLKQLTSDDNAGKLALQKQIKQLNVDVIEKVKVVNENGCFSVITKNPLNIFTFVINLIFGGYAGYRTAAAIPINPKACIPIGSCIGSTLFGGMNYSATRMVENKKAVTAVIKPDLSQNQAVRTDEYPKTAACIAVNGALASGLSMMGTAGSTVKDSAAGVTAVFYAVLMKVVNDANFSTPMVSDTLSDLIEGVKDRGIFSCFPFFDIAANSPAPTVQEAESPAPPKPKTFLPEPGKTLSFEQMRLWQSDKKDTPPSSSSALNIQPGGARKSP